jgi:lysyl-tRNA synthetase class 2
MTRIQEEETNRLAKLRKLEEAGLNPYPSKTGRTRTIHDCLYLFDELFKKKETIIIAGRVRMKRVHGGLSFAQIEDGTERMQIALRKDNLGAGEYKLWQDLIDIGDFVEVQGKVFLTKTGEPTVEAASFRVLAKSLLPLPEKWHGLSDIETRYRQRYLDLLSNPEVKNIFVKRARILKFIRNFLDNAGFLEVETPVLQPIAGGAAAKPFVTHHNALDIDLYLRIAPELYLKRLIVGGLNKVYEIARCFRNEGIDYQHNPEFTQVEFYWAYADYEDLMRLAEEMITKLLLEVNSSLELVSENTKLDFSLPWKRVTFREALLRETGIDIDKANTEKSLLEAIKKKKLEVDTSKLYGYGDLAEALYKDYVRPRIIQPTLLLDYPAAMIPLAKRKEDDKSKIATVQLVVKGMEIFKAYNELNDPIDQEKRFAEQEKLRAAGAEVGMSDRDFVEALRHGMPPTAGFGMGIDRLTALLTGSHNLKEVILFPTLRPEK